MTDAEFKEMFGISEQDKLDLVKRLSQDVAWSDDLIIEQDELFDSERDVYSTEDEVA